jgi:2-polyprenyl-3-methyl-5-hydroxy-6-metoxy-1,4-benzoquinol methylase
MTARKDRKLERKIFAKMMENSDEELFDRKMFLEKSLAESLLKADSASRDYVYEEVYDKIHNFFLQNKKDRSFLYKSLTTIPLWTTTSMCRVIGKNKKVLEVGCGDGILSLALASNGNDVIGIDVSSTCISISRRNSQIFGVNAEFRQLNGVKLDFLDESFDCVISKDLFEHLHPSDVYVHLKETYRVLKSKGFYLIITPDKLVGFSNPLHLKEYTCHELNQMLKAVGFSSIKSFLLHHYLPFNLIVPVTNKICFEKNVYRLKNRLHIPSNYFVFLMMSAIGLADLSVIAYKNAD